MLALPFWPQKNAYFWYREGKDPCFSVKSQNGTWRFFFLRRDGNTREFALFRNTVLGIKSEDIHHFQIFLIDYDEKIHKLCEKAVISYLKEIVAFQYPSLCKMEFISYIFIQLDIFWRLCSLSPSFYSISNDSFIQKYFIYLFHFNEVFL